MVDDGLVCWLLTQAFTIAPAGFAVDIGSQHQSRDSQDSRNPMPRSCTFAASNRGSAAVSGTHTATAFRARKLRRVVAAHNVYQARTVKNSDRACLDVVLHTCTCTGVRAATVCFGVPRQKRCKQSPCYFLSASYSMFKPRWSVGLALCTVVCALQQPCGARAAPEGKLQTNLRAYSPMHTHQDDQCLGADCTVLYCLTKSSLVHHKELRIQLPRHSRSQWSQSMVHLAD